MRAILTRVTSASVTIEGQTVGQIEKGFLILLGVGPNDTEKECRYLAEKALGFRIFEDENGKMNLGLDSVGGQVLVVSQFTLYGNCRKGRRPSFTDAAGPELGNRLYETKLYMDTAEMFAWTVVIVLISFLVEKGFLWLLNKINGKITDGFL